MKILKDKYASDFIMIRWSLFFIVMFFKYENNSFRKYFMFRYDQKYISETFVYVILSSFYYLAIVSSIK